MAKCFTTWTVLPHEPIEKHAENLWSVSGKMPGGNQRRMTIVRRADGKLVIHKAPGAIKPPTLTLKRAKNSSKALWDWHEAMILGNVSSGRKEGSIVLKSYDGSEVARYNFKGAWISKLEVGTLKAGANEVLPETATIVTEAIERV